jgi:diphosphomevalonate decarboxylase
LASKRVSRSSVVEEVNKEPRMRTARARAYSNMALVKYWGKRDDELVLPFTGSLSMTLDALVTESAVTFTGEPGADSLLLDGAPARAGEVKRATALLDLVRAEDASLGAANVESHNSFPTAGGLASSASGFAALAAAAAWAAGQTHSLEALSVLARRASGSACRSLFGGFVEWVRGERADGLDSIARPVLERDAWKVAMAIAIVDTGRKEKSSRDAMKQSVLTSPYFDAWVQTTQDDLGHAREAVLAKDLERLGAIAERSFLKMHATAMTSDPPAIFWKPATLAVLETVRWLRADGVGAWATIDAGPHVAVLSAAEDVAKVETALKTVAGVRDVVVARPGPGVERL